MKQPELGKKISELRKSKGLTQEELVELCNVSVRTIQRIETGEVTPRSYTVKTILSALDYDISDIRTDKPVRNNLIKWLNFGWVAGLVYFFLGFPEGLLDLIRYGEGLPFAEGDINPAFYVMVKALALASYLFFLRGFYILGSVKGATYLKFIAIVLMSFMIGVIGFDVLSFFYQASHLEAINVGIIITYGLLSIGFGIALFHERRTLGTPGILAAILEVFAGLLYLIMIPLGLLFQMPAEILEAIILYKAVQQFSTKPDE